MTIGFIGIGTMGKPMALNLVRAGHEVFVYDIVTAAVQEMIDQGAKGCASIQEIARVADVVVTMLPNAKIVESVLTGENGLLSGSRSGQVIIDMSSVSPTTTRDMARLAAEKGVHYMDAPVSGGVVGAKNGTLTIMVGGNKDIFSIVEPIFRVLGDKIFYVGDIGSGDAVKLVNNLLLGCNMASVAEALVLGKKMGLEPQTMYDIIKSSSGRSYALEAKTPGFILKGNFNPGFTIDLQYKDLELSLQTAKGMDLPLPLTAIAQQVFEMARAHGLGKEDISAVIKVWEELAGVSVRAQ